jgi:hypothetical protein
MIDDDAEGKYGEIDDDAGGKCACAGVAIRAGLERNRLNEHSDAWA